MNNLNMCRILKKPTLRMEEGGAMEFAPSVDPASAQLRKDRNMSMAVGLLNSHQNLATPTISSTPITLKEGGVIHADVGGMWANAKRALQGQPPETMREKFARQDAARAQTAAAPPPPPQPIAAPVPETAAPLGNQSVIDKRMKDAEKRAGLRDGGTLRTGEGGKVPGSGEGDKIPAKYEPGEFVVSNDMLDAAPHLREELHDLRGHVLAAKGMTPAEADAKALSGTGLRAVDGKTNPTDWTSRNLQGQRMSLPPTPMQSMADTLRAPTVATPIVAAAPPKYTPPPVDSSTGRYAHEAQTGQRPVVASAPSAVGGAGNATGGVGAAPGLAEPKPTSLWGKTKAAGNAVGGGVKNVISGNFLNADVGAAAGRTLRSGAALGRSVLESPFTPAALAAGGIAGAVQGANTPTEQYRLRAGMEQAGGLGGDLLARGVGVMADVGDAVTFGGATRLGNYLTGKGFNPNNPDGSAPGDTFSTSASTAQPNTPNLRSTNQRGQNFDGPSRASLGASSDRSNELNGAKNPLPADLREGVVHKTVDAQGRVTYSGRNVGMNANDEVQLVDGKGQQLRMLNGRGNNYAYATDGKGNATGPTAFADGNTLRAGGNPNYDALMAAAKRGDVTALREYYANKGEGFGGMSLGEYKAERAKQAQADEEANMFKGMSPTRRAAALNQYRQVQVQKDHNNVLRENQATQMEIGKMSNQVAHNKALQEQSNKDRDFFAGRYDKGVELDGKAMDSARKALTIYGRDKDGKPYADEAQTNAAFELAQRQNPKWATLSPGEQARHLTTARDVTQLIGNLDKNQNNTWWQKYGLGNNNAKLSTLPNLKGATLETLGIGSGLATAGASSGDYRLIIDGKPLYLTREDVSDDQLAFLEKQGVKIKKD